MITRLAIRRARRKARILSLHSELQLFAQVDGITVGKFRKGREVK